MTMKLIVLTGSLWGSKSVLSAIVLGQQTREGTELGELGCATVLPADTEEAGRCLKWEKEMTFCLDGGDF